MKMKYFLPLLAFSISIMSCKKELMPQDSSSTPKDSTAVAATPASAMPVNPGQMQPQMQVTPQMVQGQPMAVTPANTTPVKVAKGMNPPHGQPGHRCDIAVGAPLNSPVKAPVADPKMGKANVVSGGQTISAPAVVTAPGMNPPHGQEGHRCDIAVGAPLNPPATTNETAVPATLTPATPQN